MNLKTRDLQLIVACIFALASCGLRTPAAASGYMQMPEQTQAFPSFNACLRFMENVYRENRAQEKPETVSATGAIRSVSFESATNGIKWVSKHQVHYTGRLWYHNGGLLLEQNQIESSHSWQETDMRCNGRAMTIKSANGFTMTTFDPVPLTAPK